jgi:arylsulfatase A-like enzyme
MSGPGADGRSENATSSVNESLRQRKCAPTLVAAVEAGVCVALVGSVLIGAGECVLVAATVSAKLVGETIPPDFLVAMVGRNAFTHTLFWCPILILVALGYWCIAHRRPDAAPIPALSALAVMLVATLVISADLELGGKTKWVPHIGGWGAAVVLGAATYTAMRFIHRRVGQARLKRATRVVTVSSLLVMVATGVVFVRSPLYSAATWRAPASSVRHAPGSKPNVLWIVLDTARADRMSCYGYPAPTTPFLDEWATESVIFEGAIANGMWTVPTHASMFTGLSVREHGTDHRHLWLDDSFRTVADALAARGYATALFSNNPLVAPSTNLTKGFQAWRIVYHLRHLNRFSLDFLCEKWGLTPTLPWLDRDFGAALTNYFIDDWLDAHPDGPKFVFVNYMEAHLPYRVPRRHRRRFLGAAGVDRSYDLRRRVYGNLVQRLDRDYNIQGSDFLSASDCQVLRRQYEAAIRYLDDRVRELIEMYRQRGLLGNTLVVIASDHGEHLGTHGLWGHRFLTYQDLARVALQIREPGRRQGVRISTPVQLSDLYATVLNATLGPLPDEPLGSTSDLLAVAARGGEPRVAVCECNGPAPVTMRLFEQCTDPVVLHRTTCQIAAVGPRFKLIHSADGDRELYDLHEDPDELHNLIDERPQRAEWLEAYVRAWLAATAPYAGPGEADESGLHDALDSLRDLGYVGNN